MAMQAGQLFGNSRIVRLLGERGFGEVYKFLLGIALGCALCLSLPICEGRAQAAGLSSKDTAKAKQAKQLYKAGNYEAAAEIFLRLSNDYPDMLVLTRNLGACYYYSHRPEPALSNLREYLERARNITAEDRREVEGWIAEMEKLRNQMAASTAPVSPPPPVASAVPPSTPGPSVAAEPALPNPPSAAPLPTPAQQGLDLRQTPVGQEGAVAPKSGSRWWLWTGIGAVVVGGVVTAVLLSTRSPGREGSCTPGLSCIVVGQ